MYASIDAGENTLSLLFLCNLEELIYAHTLRRWGGAFRFALVHPKEGGKVGASLSYAHISSFIL